MDDENDDSEDDSQNPSDQEADQLIAEDEVKNLKDEGIASPSLEDSPYQIKPHAGPVDYVSPPRTSFRKIAFYIFLILLIGFTVWVIIERQNNLNQIINSRPPSIPAPQ